MDEAEGKYEPFKRMYSRILANSQETYGGAFVIVPPKDGGEVIETLILDSGQDAAQFWGLLKIKCELALAQIDEQQRATQVWRR